MEWVKVRSEYLQLIRGAMRLQKLMVVEAVRTESVLVYMQSTLHQGVEVRTKLR
jgi:hypothetical protein